MRRRGYNLAVEGPIGVGKTTLSTTLRGARRPPDLRGRRQQSHSFSAALPTVPDKYAFPAQLYFLLTATASSASLKQQYLFTAGEPRRLSFWGEG